MEPMLQQPLPLDAAVILVNGRNEVLFILNQGYINEQIQEIKLAPSSEGVAAQFKIENKNLGMVCSLARSH